MLRVGYTPPHPMDRCPHCFAPRNPASPNPFCLSCGADIRVPPEPTERQPIPASHGELLRSLRDIAAQRAAHNPATGTRRQTIGYADAAPESEATERDPFARPNTQSYGDETQKVRLQAIRRPELVHSKPPIPDDAATAEYAPWSLTLDQAESTLCARVASYPHASKRLVDLLCLVAAADGEVDDEEKAALARTLAVLLGSDLQEAIVSLLIRGSLDEIDVHGFQPRIELVAQALRDCSAIEEGLMLAIAMAYVSDGFSQPERSVVRGLAKSMGVTDARLQALVQSVREQVDPGV
jgi:tellurite resistance protein